MRSLYLIVSPHPAAEMRFAREQGIQIIPVIVQGGGWRASGWLGLLTAGALWTPMHDHATFSADVANLVKMVVQATASNAASLNAEATAAAATVGKAEPDGDDDGATVAGLRRELDQLRVELSAHAASTHATNVDGLAVLPGEVPVLRDNLATTPGMLSAKQTLLASSASSRGLAISSKNQPAAGSKLGTFGMGGIGTIFAS
jgi:hypothetical protein